MTTGKHAAWGRHLDAVADEIVRLSALCDVDLRVPGTIDRVLQGDAAVCHRKNAIAFRKLRRLLAATYDSVNKAIGRIGAEGVKQITDEIVARVDRQRRAGGQGPGHPGNPLVGR